MATYYVQVGYKTKRGGVELGMDVEAFSPEDAEESGKDRALKGYPARKWCYTRVREANNLKGQCVISTPARQP
jgi:hypothetical protein